MGAYFVNPLFLSALLLGLVPIVIHLLNRQRYRVEHWAAMDFLFAAAMTNRRRIKFQDLLLLLLRVLVIVLLVLGFARPLLEGVSLSRVDEKVVILDDSFSMDVVTPAGPLFERARNIAVSEVEDALGRSISVTAWLGDSTAPLGWAKEHPGGSQEAGTSAEPGGGPGEVHDPMGELGEPRDLGELGELSRVTTKDTPLRLGKVLASALEEWSVTDAKTRLIVLISDFRRSDWLDDGGNLTESLGVAFQQLQEHPALLFRWVNVGAGDVDNLAIADFRLVSKHAIKNIPVRMELTVQNFSQKPYSGLVGNLEVGSSEAGSFRLSQRIPLPPFETIEPGEAKQVELTHTFDKAGQYPLRITLRHDLLPRDDESYLVVNVRESLRCLVIDGDPAVDRFAGESGYLVAALAPRGQRQTGIEPRVAGNLITKDAVRDEDVVMVLNRPSLASDEWTVLESFVQRGGGLVFFLGNRIDPRHYRPKTEAPLFPVVLRSPYSPAARVPLRLGGFEHPPLKVFQGVEGVTIEKVLFSRYFSLDALPGATVVARFADGRGEAGTPAIVEASVGPGRVAVFNTSADRDWSDWPADTSFPVVLQEWVHYLAPQISAANNMPTGRVIRWPAAPGKSYEVVGPDGSVHPVRQHAVVSDEDLSAEEIEPAADPNKAEASRGVAEYSETFHGGFYRVRQAGRSTSDRLESPEGSSLWFACRRPLVESDLAAFDEAELESFLQAHGIRYAFGQEAEASSEQAAQPGEVWRWLALGAAAALLLELFLAWWVGRGVS